jgi:hypothetical protein
MNFDCQNGIFNFLLAGYISFLFQEFNSLSRLQFIFFLELNIFFILIKQSTSKFTFYLIFIKFLVSKKARPQI